MRIDKHSGAVFPVGNRGLADFPNIGGLAIGPNGSFWALNSTGNNVELLSIDKELGTARSLGVITNFAEIWACSGWWRRFPSRQLS